MGGGRCLPASLVLSRELSVADALGAMDGQGPLPSDVLQELADFEFVLQPLLPEDSGQDRQPLQTLKPEPELGELLRGSLDPIVFLEAFAALAPRQLAGALGLRPVVQEELAALLRESRSKGRAVLFALGSDRPLELARKVYLRPAFVKLGVRCGYLRWRRRAAPQWARESAKVEERICLGLSLPE